MEKPVARILWHTHVAKFSQISCAKIKTTTTYATRKQRRNVNTDMTVLLFVTNHVHEDQRCVSSSTRVTNKV